jgi:hypothetical protein
MKRSQLLGLIWGLALLGPLLNLAGVLLFRVYDNYWLIALTSPRDIFEVIAGIFAAFALPAAPFLILGSLGMQQRLDETPTFGSGAIIGSTIGAAISVLGGWLILWITVLLVGDGGAAVGYWGIICSFPIFVPLFMLSGWNLGERYDRVIT